MWNSLGSLRDRVRENANRVRENAKAAAQVAQDVLQAAAAEGDDDEDLDSTNPQSHPVPTVQQSSDTWADWHSDPAAHHSTPPPPSSPLPPSSPPPPPPPPEDTLTPSDSSSAAETMLATVLPPRVRPSGSSKYVVAGLAETGGGGALPPRPTIDIVKPRLGGPFDSSMEETESDVGNNAALGEADDLQVRPGNGDKEEGELLEGDGHEFGDVDNEWEGGDDWNIPPPVEEGLGGELNVALRSDTAEQRETHTQDESAVDEQPSVAEDWGQREHVVKETQIIGGIESEKTATNTEEHVAITEGDDRISHVDNSAENSGGNEWNVGAHQASDVEGAHFWGVPADENGQPEIDDDWKFSEDGDNEANTANDWNVPAKVAEESADTVSFNTQSGLIVNNSLVAGESESLKTTAEQVLEPNDTDGCEPVLEEQQHNHFEQDGWEISNKVQGPATESEPQAFAWGHSQRPTYPAVENGMDWFSSVQGQIMSNELTTAQAESAEDFFGTLSHSSQTTDLPTAARSHADENFERVPLPLNGAHSIIDAITTDNGVGVAGNKDEDVVHVPRSDRSNDDVVSASGQPTSQAFEHEHPPRNAETTLLSDSFQTEKGSLAQSQNQCPPSPTQDSTCHDTMDADATTSSFSYHSDAEATALREEVKQLKFEKSATDAAREVNERDVHDLKQTVERLEDDFSARNEDVSTIARERDELRIQLNQLIAEKIQVERERDAAIEQGGDGIREARGVIEAMRTSQDVAERREYMISEQIEALRVDLDRISGERNAVLTEADDLRLSLKEVETQAKAREDALKQELQLLQDENGLARMELDKAIVASQLHVQEHQELLQTEQATSASLAASELKIRELESVIDSMHRDRADEVASIESFSVQVEDMKERTKSVIEERNALYDEKLELQKEVEVHSTHAEESRRALSEIKREYSALTSERDEARSRYATLRDQFNETSKQFEAISSERNRLVEERTYFANASTSTPDKEKVLAEECQQKTAALAALQRKLVAAMTKLEKLSGQKATYQRQRDEAGARLRAAGAEFAALNGKLENSLKARDQLQDEVKTMRDERDDAISQIQDLSGKLAAKKLVDESLENATKQLKEAQEKVAKAHEEIRVLHEAKSNLQQKCVALASDANTAQGKCEVIARERDITQSQMEALLEGKEKLQVKVIELEDVAAASVKNQKSAEAELTTAKEKFALDVHIVKAELATEQKIRSEQAEKLLSLQNTAEEYKAVIFRLQDAVSSSLESARYQLKESSDTQIDALQLLNESVVSDPDDFCQATVTTVSNSCNLLVALCRELSKSLKEVDAIRQESEEFSKKLYIAQQESAASRARDDELFNTRSAYELTQQKLLTTEDDRRAMEIRCQSVEESLKHSENRILELDDQLRTTTYELRQEVELNTRTAGEERSRLIQELEDTRSKLESIWDMLQRSLFNYQVDFFNEKGEDFTDSSGVENVPVLALRATASVVAELERNRLSAEEIGHRLVTAEAEVTRLVDRAELAEQERNALRGTNERLEKKAKIAYTEGEEAARTKFETLITQIEDELDDVRQELKHVSDKASRSEKEAGELRALCSKLTSQLNGRTNELDEAEEKVVYLQDQITNLEEDLQEAHRRLKEHEEETAEARRNDVERLTGELTQAMKQVETFEMECAQLREACDVAENTARESELLAETHRKAEANLQIAIEQLEAAQDSAVEERTIELQRKVQEADERCARAKKREEEIRMTENKLTIRDDEIKELRGAIGRLADERVELKLELEKSLSRLNHPDTGGQLVDRRVVRQLLVSYFRVGSLRRRDVLELMSRMLGFSEADNVAVGLKRRALMERIGSLVQPPELDDPQLPPLGTVSEKWIEFLMNETEEGEDQGKGW